MLDLRLVAFPTLVLIAACGSSDTTGAAGAPGAAGASGSSGTTADGGAGVPLVATVDAFVTGTHTGETSVWIAGYHAAADGGGGLFVLDPSACAAKDGGTVIADAGGSCFRRATSNHGPREFGAYGDGTHDDTKALQAWLNATQPHIGDVGEYLVSDALTCPTGAVLEGPGVEYQQAGMFSPPFRFSADKDHWNPAAKAMMIALSFCRIAGAGFLVHGVANGVVVSGDHVSIDSRTSIIGGFSNVVNAPPANGGTQQGLQIKDSQLSDALGYNLNLDCVNVRLVGNIIAGAGISNLYYTGVEITVSDNIVEEADGDGIVFDGASSVKLSANQINKNGKGPMGGAGLVIRGSSVVSVTGNEFNKTGGGVASNAGSAHVRFEAPANATIANVTFAGNVYNPFDLGQGVVPSYAYDVGASNGTFSTLSIYEKAAMQSQGVSSSKAIGVFNAIGQVFH